MKTYLSKYWIINSLLLLGMVLLVIVAAAIFCVLYPSEENYIIILGVLFYVLLYAYLLSISIKLIRYVVEEENGLVMYSFFGKKLASVDLNSKIYLKKCSVLEGILSKREFLLLSNAPINIFCQPLKGLAQLCKVVDLSADVVILPYPNKYVGRLNTERNFDHA